jgi:CelD/BcsL family acetyltransferase involved in cellulose biosynthesis
VSANVAMICSLDELAQLRPEWDALYAEAAPRNPFLSAAWTSACLETTARGTEPCVFILREEGRLRALAPLSIERRSGFRVLRFIAEGRADYLGFLCSPGDPCAAAKLLEAVVNRSELWDLVILKQLRSDHWDLGLLRPPGSVTLHSADAGRAPYTAADVDWDMLHQVGPSWLKRTRKRLPRFLRDGWQLERLTGEQAAARLDDVAKIEAHSWKAAKNVMRLQPGGGQELFRRAFEALGASGEMQLWLASLDGRAAAYEIDFVLPQQLWIYQLGYDQEFQRASVGSFLNYVAIERAWRAGAREYDYMSGEEAYKHERTACARAIRHLAFYKRTTRGRAAYVLLLAPRWLVKDLPVARAAYRFWTTAKELLHSWTRSTRQNPTGNAPNRD